MQLKPKRKILKVPVSRSVREIEEAPVEVEEEQEDTLTESIDMDAVRSRMKKLVKFSAFEQKSHYLLKTPYPHLHRVLGGPAGIPYGRVIELHGFEHGGKTLIGQILMAAAQKDGAGAIHLDNENSADAQWASKLGVNWDNLVLIQPKLLTGLTKKQKEELKDATKEERKAAKASAIPRLQSAEELFDEAEAAVVALHEAGCEKKIVLIDSIANLITLKQLEAGQTGQTMNTNLDLAVFLSYALKRWAGIAANYNALVVVINQMRAVPGQMFGDPYKTPAGQALKHACANRCRVRRLKQGQLKQGGHVVGIVGIIRNVKNKMGDGSVEGEECAFMVNWQKPKARIEFMTPREAEAILKGE